MVVVHQLLYHLSVVAVGVIAVCVARGLFLTAALSTVAGVDILVALDAHDIIGVHVVLYKEIGHDCGFRNRVASLLEILIKVFCAVRLQFPQTSLHLEKMSTA